MLVLLLHLSHSLSPPLCPQVFSLHLCLHSFPANGHQYHFSRFHIYVLIYFFFSLTYFTLYNRLQVHLPHWKWLKFVIFLMTVIFHCIYVPHLYPFINHTLLIAYQLLFKQEWNLANNTLFEKSIDSLLVDFSLWMLTYTWYCVSHPLERKPSILPHQ